jgi:hypothetical protein
MKKTPDKVECIIASVQASMAAESMNPSAEARAIGKQYLEGKISGKEAIANFGK